FILNLPETQFPEEVNLTDYVLNRHLVSEEEAQRTAFYSGDRVITYKALNQMVNRMGNGLRGLGIGKGDVVMLRIPNSVEFVVCALALHRLGAIVIPTMVLLREKTLTYVANASEAKAIICAHDILDEIELGRPKHQTVKHIVAIGGDRAELKARGYASYEELIESSIDQLESVKVRRDDVAAVFFTSGTTGAPKGCMHMNMTLMGAPNAVPATLGGMRPDDIVSGSPPLAFVFGYGYLMLFPLLHSIPSILIEGRLSPERMFETIEKYKVTIFCSAPAAYNQMVNVPDANKRYDLSSLRITMSGSAPLLPATIQQWKDLFGTELMNIIGSSETFSAYLTTWQPKSKLRSLGHPLPSWEARVIDEQGNDCPTGETGRLAVKGIGGIMYWRNPEKQSEAVTNGWSLTGDLAYKDEDGCFWHVSRGDDIIKSRGYRVSPGEVEDALLEHASVFESAVIGAPDPIQGERVKAYVMLKEGHEGSPRLADELKQFLKGKLAPYMVPGEFEFVTSFPKTETGKVRRVELKQAEQQRYEERLRGEASGKEN
ncbi:MAG: acyl-CoA synthetase, partial [Chloroflexi bacterium]|nr:acyl-CoA synthetase [Chloroflexota bacterium]